MWSLVLGWSIISFGFYIFSVYVGWDWLESRLRDGNSDSTSSRSRRSLRNHKDTRKDDGKSSKHQKDADTERKEPTSNWSFASGLPRTNTRVITNSKVRDYLEQLVAKQLGGSPLDLTNTTAVNQPQYRKFVQTYHVKLTNALVDLGKSLHLRTPDYDNDGKPLQYSQPASETSQENFIKLLVQVKEAAMDVGHIEDDQTIISKSSSNDHEEPSPVINTSTGTTTTISDNNVEKNYEDILSTAILNKVITDMSLGGTRKSLSPVISVVDSAVQTDNDGELSGTGSGKYNVKSWVDGFSNFSDDDISLGTSSSNWSGGDGVNPPVVHQIEEHVEITYETNETDSDTSQESSSSSPLPHQQRPRKGKKVKQQPVPFPEHGVDIVDCPEELDEEEPSKKISQVLAWEQNWLFKRKKKPILFSKMAAESVPMLVPNPSSTAESDLNDELDDHDGEKMSDIEDEDFNGGYFEFPEGHKAATETNVNLTSNTEDSNDNIDDDGNEDDGPPPDIKWPQDVEIAAGKTARVSVTVPDPELAPPIWRLAKSKRILGPTSDKIEIKAEPPRYTLIIHNAQECDAGLYQIVLKRNNRLGAGSEISRNFRFNVRAVEKKKCIPIITVFPDVVSLTKSTNPLTVDFELAGHPEPVLNVFKGNDIITSLDNKGKGRWTLSLRWQNDKDALKIPGEYVAVATNTQGTTRATFKIESKDEPSSPPVATVKDEVVKSKSSQQHENTPEIEAEPRSSSASPAEETLRETSHSIVTNDTVEMEDDDSNRRFTVAEREKSKWANPIKLEFNPYAPENLAKRIRAGRNNRDLLVSRTNNVEDSPEPAVPEESFLRPKKQATPEPNIVMIEKPAKLCPSDIVGVKLPSVKELAQHFAPMTDKSPTDYSNKPLQAHRDIGKSMIQVHSLTARSVSREFREGLKISKGPISTAQNIVKLNNGSCNNSGGGGDKAINSTVSYENNNNNDTNNS